MQEAHEAPFGGLGLGALGAPGASPRRGAAGVPPRGRGGGAALKGFEGSWVLRV